MKKAFVYLLCLSFLLMMNDLPRMEAEGKSIPIGEMVSKGEVKFEARENVWKRVESSHFPIFQGTKIKTDKGIAVVTLSNNIQIEVNFNSLFSLDQNDRFVLSQGSIEFRIPAASEINFKVGNLTIMKSRALQAAKNPTGTSSSSEETIGSISIHGNGAVTVKSAKGELTIINQERVVLAAVSSKDSVTIPSITVGAKPPARVAQVGDVAAAGDERIFGVSTETALWLAGGLIGLGVAIWAISEALEKKEEKPVCP